MCRVNLDLAVKARVINDLMHGDRPNGIIETTKGKLAILAADMKNVEEHHMQLYVKYGRSQRIYCNILC